MLPERMAARPPAESGSGSSFEAFD